MNWIGLRQPKYSWCGHLWLALPSSVTWAFRVANPSGREILTKNSG